MDARKRRRLERYFSRLPEWPFVLASVGFLLLILGPGWEGKVPGAASLAVAAWSSVRFLRDSPSDADFDALTGEDIEQLQAHARERCDILDEIATAVLLIGPRFRNMGGAQFSVKRGSDGIARFTPLDVTIIHFTEHQLVTYQCALDLITGKPLNERCDEFFYTDVVNVSLRTDSYTYDLADLDAKILARVPKLAESAVNGKVQVASAEIFRLVTAGGTSIEVMLSDPSLIEQLGGGRIDTARTGKAVQAVRLMVRDKKAGALPLRRPTT